MQPSVDIESVLRQACKAQLWLSPYWGVKHQGVLICGSDTLVVGMPVAENMQFHAH